MKIGNIIQKKDKNKYVDDDIDNVNKKIKCLNELKFVFFHNRQFYCCTCNTHYIDFVKS